MNLEKLFGDTVFDHIEFLDTGADKDSSLAKYRGSGYFWIEDKFKNAEVGAAVGLQSLIMEHGHNLGYSGPIRVVKNWADIYSVVTGYTT